MNSRQTGCGDGGADDDEGRAEPVIFLPAVQHELEAAEKTRDQAKPIASNLMFPLLHIASRCLRLSGEDGQQQRHGHERAYANRDVDQKAPVPGPVVAEPASEGRADGRSEHHGNAIDREAARALVGRKSRRENALRHRRHAAARQALEQAKNQQGLKAPGETAGEGADREQRGAGHEEILAPKNFDEPARRAEHDSVGDEIGGDHPGRFVRADREAAGNVAQRDIGDGGVEHFHEGCDRDQHGDQIGIGSAIVRFCSACAMNQRTLTVGTTDMPGPICTSGGLSKTILTGTRCTTLT